MKGKKSSVVNDLVITGLLAVIALLVSAGAGWTIVKEKIPERTLAEELRELEGRTILETTPFEERGRSLVFYTYLGEKLPEKLASDEVVERRTSSSYTRLLIPQHENTAQKEMTLETRVYPQKTFIQRGGEWYYLEYGHTTREAMEKHQAQNSLQAFFAQVAYAVDIFAGSGDGFVRAEGSDWATPHDAAVGSSFQSTSTVFVVGSEFVDIKGAFIGIHRGFLPFDTSSIPVSAVISAATLSAYATTSGSSSSTIDNDGDDYITVIQTSQATHTVLANADYNNAGATTTPTEGIATSEREDVSSMATGTYKMFTLNSTGRGWIAKSGQASNCSGTSGITCLGLRSGHDTTNSAVTLNTNDIVTFTTSESTGTSVDPFLSITYVLPFAFWQFQDF